MYDNVIVHFLFNPFPLRERREIKCKKIVHSTAILWDSSNILNIIIIYYKERREGLIYNIFLNHIYFVHQKSLKPTLKTGVWVRNHLLHLSFIAVNSQYVFLTQIRFGECNKCLLIEFVIPYLRRIYLYQISLKRTFKTGFWVLCSSAVISLRLLCSQKAGVKCSY